MKSQNPSPKLKSPSREELLAAAAEQYKVMVRKRMVAMADTVPDGYFTAMELSKQMSMHHCAVKKMLRKMGVKPLNLKVFTGDTLQYVDHYRLE